MKTIISKPIIKADAELRKCRTELKNKAGQTVAILVGYTQDSPADGPVTIVTTELWPENAVYATGAYLVICKPSAFFHGGTIDSLPGDLTPPQFVD